MEIKPRFGNNQEPENKEIIVLPEDVVVPSPEKMNVWCVEINTHQKRYFLSEESYRKEVATHQKCLTCDTIIKARSFCRNCSEKRSIENYLKKPFKEWDLTTPVCLHHTYQFFWNTEEIDEYLEENELEPSELDLVICAPNHVSAVTEEYWADDMPENYDELSDFNKEFVQKLKEFNEYISTLEPLSWGEGLFRTEYKPEPNN